MQGSSYDDAPITRKDGKKYTPSSCEKYIMDHTKELGYHSPQNPKGCLLWTDPNATNPNFHQNLMAFARDMEAHTAAVKEFEPIPDLLQSIIQTGNHDACAAARPHPDGLMALFPSNQLSLSASSGYVEPLTPPMRSAKICQPNMREAALMSIDYLVHDFEAMCRRLKPTSKRVLVDMGASLSFHQGSDQPVVLLLELYEKFGFIFDHIYGFEITFTEPKKVFEDLLPEKYMASYHWINVGVNPERGHKMNPLYSILERFNEDDFVVVKLDVDTSSVEVPLARQLLEDKGGVYSKLVDQFYFEHHVHLGDLAPNWLQSMNGTVEDSLDLFYGLREKGIPAHYWP